MTSRRAVDSFTEIATLRIELKDSEPPIWRVIEVPASITLEVLHDIVQAAMGGWDYHLWELVIDGQTFGLPMDDDWSTAPHKLAARTRLRDVLAHRAAYPRFIEGERDCSPEDDGGIPGFYETLEVRADPNNPDHAGITEWLDEYNPDKLDIFPIQAALGRMAAPAAAAMRIIKPTND